MGDAPQAARSQKETEALDAELFQQLAAGDVGALQTILQEHWFGLMAYASRIVESSDEAEDVVQEVFVRLWERRATWTPAASVSSLLCRMTRNLALNVRRHQEVRTRSSWMLQEWSMQNGQIGDPSAKLEADQLEAAVSQAIQQLPPRRREVLILARFHRMSYQQIAGVAGVSVQTVANQISAAFRQLRRTLSPLWADNAPRRTQIRQGGLGEVGVHQAPDREDFAGRRGWCARRGEGTGTVPEFV